MRRKTKAPLETTHLCKLHNNCYLYIYNVDPPPRMVCLSIWYDIIRIMTFFRGEKSTRFVCSTLRKNLLDSNLTCRPSTNQFYRGMQNIGERGPRGWRGGSRGTDKFRQRSRSSHFWILYCRFYQTLITFHQLRMQFKNDSISSILPVAVAIFPSHRKWAFATTARRIGVDHG